jgi:HEPN domain-containing protein
MGRAISFMEKLSTGYSFADLGYRDYIAARFLLNNHFIVQGLTLASTAVEKYLKAVIAFNLQEKEWYNYHFDRFEKLKNLLSKVNNDVTEEFDPLFIEILEKAFKIRYYDKIEQPIFMGFYINQFIGELDYTINYLENFIFNTESCGQSITLYSKAVIKKDSDLFYNNYILNQENKKDYMEMPDIGFSIYISVGSVVHREEIAKGGKTQNKYEGHIAEFKEFGRDFLY